ncbi:hypothetical protein BU23DRAFT_549687 [Bimuria novae-zelandiae CBS 107.79]|uniref:RING-type domain-containing protein n=1 Tax=Bimuria novae-zelandiae CBS 107.79 TaxID=1447943 RepID=A0A6A5VQD1_9PLEO|nr:hypothetical protein BU23DRAFT_549687 [Bimuria novae-zelandiae CBS 107.79]
MQLKLNPASGRYTEYALSQPFGPLPPDRTDCPICWRTFGAREDSEDESPCHPLLTPCNHYLGSVCADKIVHRTLSLRCPMCFSPIPRCKKTLTQRLHEISRWPLFSQWPPFSLTVVGVNAQYGGILRESYAQLTALALRGYIVDEEAGALFIMDVASAIMTAAAALACCGGNVVLDLASQWGVRVLVNWEIWKPNGALLADAWSLESLSVSVLDVVLTVGMVGAWVATRWRRGSGGGRLVGRWLAGALMVRGFFVLSYVLTGGVGVFLGAVALRFWGKVCLAGAFAVCAYWRI